MDNATTTEVVAENSDDLQGPDLMERMKKHAEKFGVEIPMIIFLV